MNSRRWYRLVAIAAVIVAVVLGVRACGPGGDTSNIDPGEKIDAELTLQTVTLEQPDENGTLMWRLKAKSVTYSPDNQRAELAELDGEFFQAGETIYTVTADEGEVQQNGETLYLRGNLVATSRENELTLEGEKLKWQPKKDLLVMGAFDGGDFNGDNPANATDAAANSENDPSEKAQSESASESASSDETPSEDSPEEPSGSGAAASSAEQDTANNSGALVGAKPVIKRTAEDLLAEGNTIDKLSVSKAEKAPVTGFNPQMEAIAQIISVSSKNHRVELSGGVVAKSKETPWLTFESDRLDWFTEREVIEAKAPLKVEQYADKEYKTVTDRVVGAKGDVQLAENVVTLSDSVQLDALTQPLKVTSESAVWDVAAQTVLLDKPVNIEQPTRKITASANQANLDLGQELIVLNGNVRARGEENDARLAADQVRWQTSSQDIEAEGNVSYQQAANPEISMTGSQAFGNLEKGTVVVTGGDGGEVVTEFVPDEAL